MMIQKPLSEMTVEECEAAIRQIREARSALQADHARKVAATPPGEAPPKAKRLPKPLDNFTADILNTLMGDA